MRSFPTAGGHVWRVRPWLVLLHRYVGLALAGLLIVAGLTGSIAAFHDALDAWLNPDLFTARSAGPPLPLPQLTQRLLSQMPQAQLGYILYRPAPGETVRAYLQQRTDMATHAPYPLVENEVFVDPPTGTIQGARAGSACCFSRRALIPFLYRFHYTLGLGRAGEWVMGIAAMAWAADCVVGLLLTIPPHGAAWRNWGKAWRISARHRGFRLTFDLHRALSLWLWIILLGVAISGFALALDTQVFKPVVHALLPTTPEQPLLLEAPGNLIALDQAERLAIAAAAAKGWHAPPGALYVVPATGRAIFYFFSSTSDQGIGFGSPKITIDLGRGRIARIEMPGQGRAGDLVEHVQFPWHSGQIAGLPGRIAIALCGIAVCVLSVTGVLIWARKRRARATRGRKARGAARAQPPWTPARVGDPGPP